MPAELPYTAIVTPAEVQRAALKSDRWADDVANPDGDLYDACVDVCVDVTAQIEAYLDRTLIVRRVESPIDEGAGWEYRPRLYPTGGAYVRYLRQWPLVEVIDTDLVSGVRDDAVASSAPRAFEYFAGYRRNDQVLTVPDPNPLELVALPTDEGEDLEGLTELPGVLPGDVRRVAIRLAIAELRREVGGLVGVASRTRRVDNQVVQHQREEAGFEEAQLAKLHRHRLLPA